MSTELKMVVTVSKQETVTVSKRDLASAIMRVVAGMIGEIDDAGCDWLTDETGVYIQYRGWKVTDNKNVASLIDAVNILLHDHPLKL